MRNLLFTTIGLLSFLTSAQNLADHLLLHYTFDGNASDVSGNNNNGAPFGVTYGPDRFGNSNGACYFNGIDNYVNFPNIAALKPNLPVSFSFWVNYLSTDYNQQVIFNTSFEEDHCTGVWFNSSLATNAHAINFGNGNYYYAPDSRNTLVCYKEVAINFWKHIIVVVNSATDMKMYIGCLDNPGIYTGTGGGILAYSDTPGCIGRHDRDLNAPPGYFKGYIDDFMYWDRALTDADVNALCDYLSVKEVDLNRNEVLVFYDSLLSTLEIKSSIENLEDLSIYNLYGQEVYRTRFKSKIDVSTFASGVYFVKVSNKDKFFTKKLRID